MIKTYRNTSGNKITLSIVMNGFTHYIKLEPNGYVTLEEKYAKNFVNAGIMTEVKEQLLLEKTEKKPTVKEEVKEEVKEKTIEKPKKKKRGRPKKEDK